jgi:hypothetical protein
MKCSADAEQIVKEFQRSEDLRKAEFNQKANEN